VFVFSGVSCLEREIPSSKGNKHDESKRPAAPKIVRPTDCRNQHHREAKQIGRGSKGVIGFWDQSEFEDNRKKNGWQIPQKELSTGHAAFHVASFLRWRFPISGAVACRSSSGSAGSELPQTGCQEPWRNVCVSSRFGENSKWVRYDHKLAAVKKMITSSYVRQLN
jgi:hypothetical protein